MFSAYLHQIQRNFCSMGLDTFLSENNSLIFRQNVHNNNGNYFSKFFLYSMEFWACTLSYVFKYAYFQPLIYHGNIWN